MRDDTLMDQRIMDAIGAGMDEALLTASDAEATALARDYARIEAAIAYVLEHRLEQPELADIARHVGLSEYHFQRLFTRWAGVSPKKFLKYATLEHAKRALEAEASVLDAAFDVGLSGPSRLHDLFVTIDAVTPGEFKSRGAGLELRYGFHETPFGEALIVVSPRGITGLSFVPCSCASKPRQACDADRRQVLEEQRHGWENATWIHDQEGTRAWMDRTFASTRRSAGEEQELPLLLRGTQFQTKVWEGLLRVPPGLLATYEQIAGVIDAPGAERAIGQALSRNLLAYLIPCHRIIRKSGLISGYRWGEKRKRALIGFEAATSHAVPLDERDTDAA